MFQYRFSKYCNLFDGKAESGVALVVFAFLLIPFLAFTAFAVDLTRVMTTRTNMQRVADQAVLDILNLRVAQGWTEFGNNGAVCGTGVAAGCRGAVGAKGRQCPCTAGSVKNFYENRISSNGNSGEGQLGAEIVNAGGVTAASYDVATDTADVTISHSINTFFAPAVFGAGDQFANINITVRSGGQLSPVVVYVLADVSGSMNKSVTLSGGGGQSPKIDLLQGAVRNFATLFNPNQDMIGIVPFATIAKPGLGVTPGGFDLDNVNTAINDTLVVDEALGAQTNISDAFRVAWNDFSPGTIRAATGNRDIDVAWVLFSDGAPTAGTFQFQAAGLAGRNILNYRMQMTPDIDVNGDNSPTALFSSQANVDIAAGGSFASPFVASIDLPSPLFERDGANAWGSSNVDRFKSQIRNNGRVISYTVPPGWICSDVSTDRNCNPVAGDWDHGLAGGGGYKYGYTSRLEYIKFGIDNPIIGRDYIEDLAGHADVDDEQGNYHADLPCLGWDRSCKASEGLPLRSASGNTMRRHIAEFTDAIVYNTMISKPSSVLDNIEADGSVKVGDGGGDLLPCIAKRVVGAAPGAVHVPGGGGAVDPDDEIGDAHDELEVEIAHDDPRVGPGGCAVPAPGTCHPALQYGTCYIPDMSFCVPSSGDCKVAFNVRRMNLADSGQIFMKAYYNVAMAWAHFLRLQAGNANINSSRVFAIGLADLMVNDHDGPWYTYGHGADQELVLPNNVQYDVSDANRASPDNAQYEDVWNEDARKDSFMLQLVNDYGNRELSKTSPFVALSSGSGAVNETNCGADPNAVGGVFDMNNNKTCGEYYPIQNDQEMNDVFASIARKIQLGLIR